MRSVVEFVLKLIKRRKKLRRPQPGTDRFERALERAAAKFFA